MIKVKISDAPIPEGYTYQRCDEYTAEELLAMFTPKPSRECPNPQPKREAVQYIRKHPRKRKPYTAQDAVNIHEAIRERRVNRSPFIRANHCSKNYSFYNEADGRY